MLTGVVTALVTPFRDDGSLDEEALARLLERQVAGGVQGVLLLGTTGEAAALADEERQRVLQTALRVVGGKVTLMAGVGTNSTAKTVHYAREAAALGYEYLLVVTPYYVKPSPEGMRIHFTRVAQAVPGAKLLLYNIPSRAGAAIPPSLSAELAAELPNVVGQKESQPDLTLVSQLLMQAPPDFTLFAGDGGLVLPMLSLGARGAVSVVSNVLPKETAELVNAALNGDYDRARRLHYRLFPLVQALFSEPSPSPCKTALSLLGLCDRAVRPPLVPVGRKTQQRLKELVQG